MNDTRDTYEAIMLGSQAVNYMAYRLMVVQRELEAMRRAEGNGKVLKLYEHHVNEKADVLNEVLADIYKVAENLGNYMSNHDIVDDDDVQATTPAYERMRRALGIPEPQASEGEVSSHA